MRRPHGTCGRSRIGRSSSGGRDTLRTSTAWVSSTSCRSGSRRTRGARRRPGTCRNPSSGSRFSNGRAREPPPRLGARGSGPRRPGHGGNPTETARHPARPRRGRVRVLRPAPAPGDSAVRAGVQLQDAGHLRRLRPDSRGVRPDARGHPPRAARRQRRDDRSRVSGRPPALRRARRRGCRCGLRGALVEPETALDRGLRRALRPAAGSRGPAHPPSRDRSSQRGGVSGQRSAFRHGLCREAERRRLPAVRRSVRPARHARRHAPSPRRQCGARGWRLGAVRGGVSAHAPGGNLS